MFPAPVLPLVEVPVAPLVLLPVLVEAGPVPVELPLVSLLKLIESAAVLEEPLMSELPLASESVVGTLAPASAPDPVPLLLLPQELKNSVIPKRIAARKIIDDLGIR